MSLAIQWAVVGVLGLGAVGIVLRHFGFHRKVGRGCPGCGQCAVKSGKTAADLTHSQV